MRKRKAARPVLESMEVRLVPSGVSALHPTAEVRSAIASLLPAHHARLAAAHRDGIEAKAQRHHATKKPPAAHAHSSKPTSTNTISSFFKSVFPGL